MIETHLALVQEKKTKAADSFFIFDIMAVPALANRIGPQALTTFLSKFPPEIFLAIFYPRSSDWIQSKASLGSSSAASLLGNLLFLTKPRLPKMAFQFLVAFLFPFMFNCSLACCWINLWHFCSQRCCTFKLLTFWSNQCPTSYLEINRICSLHK